MKQFAFPLGRVMEWRRTQAKVEEAKLARMYADLRAIDARQVALIHERTESEDALLGASATTGLELAALDRFRYYTSAECANIVHARTACLAKITAQLQVVTIKRRDVRLLERLREQRMKTWTAGFSREIDAQADESYLLVNAHNGTRRQRLPVSSEEAAASCALAKWTPAK